MKKAYIKFGAGAIAESGVQPGWASILTAADSMREWSIVDLAARLKSGEPSGRSRLTWFQGSSSPFAVPAEDASGFFRTRSVEQ